MTIDTSALGSLKAKKKPKTTRTEWAPFDLNELCPGAYLAADPSVSAFGLVVLVVPRRYDDDSPRRTIVMAAEDFHTKEGEFGGTGWEDMLVRAGMIEGYIAEWVARWAVQYPDIIAVHEMPPMGGGKLASPESALLGSYAFRSAIGRMPRLKMVPRQTHYRMICGNANAKKPVCHKVLKETILPYIIGAELITNEAKRDALQVALCAARMRG